jgi:hexosaminidase
MKMQVGLLVALATVSVSACVGRRAAAPVDRELRRLPVVPAPAVVERGGSGPFELTTDTKIVACDAAARPIALLLRAATEIPIADKRCGDPREIDLTATAPGMGDEAYDLRADDRSVIINASTARGLFYGTQTFRQLAQTQKIPASIPSIHIVDHPRFEWRGAMLDVARRFLPVAGVKRYIDLIALYKMNRLHLHLTDDQGWRIEIKSWPELARRGGATAVADGPSGYYSQEEFVDLARYAAERFVTVVPEIDVPGHTNAALSAYAELNCDGKAPAPYTGIDVGFSALCVDRDVIDRFFDDVVGEVAALTPGPFFHLGADEVRRLTPDQFSRFLERAQRIVQRHQKRVVGWADIAVAPLLGSTIVQHWKPEGPPRGAVDQHAKFIMSPANRTYLDMKYDARTPLGQEWAGRISIRRAYDWDPATLVPGVTDAAILGVEATIWSEKIHGIDQIEWMAFPRLAAVAEVAWSPSTRRGWSDFRARLGAQAPMWSALNVHFYPAPEIPWQR